MSAPIPSPKPDDAKTPEDQFPEWFETWRRGDSRTAPHPVSDKDPWEELYKQIADPDFERCKAWKEEVENLLIFAGLFSAVVTAFIIESYKLLKEDSGDVTAALLRDIGAQLTRNGTGVVRFPPTPFSPSSSSILVNTLWFLSLVVSLATVLIGTLCLQWLREHMRLPASPRDAFALHHMQKESLDRWYIPQIMTVLPFLLQLGLVLFFVGLVVFLWQLNRNVAIVVIIAIALFLNFYIVTTILPAFQDFTVDFPRVSSSSIPRSPCPYRSAQSWAFLQLASPLFGALWNHIPKIWFRKRYWDSHRRPSDGIIRADEFSVRAYRAKSWVSHSQAWLYQRDLDIIWSQDLYDVNTYECVRSNPCKFFPSTIYDHLTALQSRTNTGTYSTTRLCLAQFINELRLSADTLSSQNPKGADARFLSSVLALSRFMSCSYKNISDWEPISMREMYADVIYASSTGFPLASMPSEPPNETRLRSARAALGLSSLGIPQDHSVLWDILRLLKVPEDIHQETVVSQWQWQDILRGVFSKYAFADFPDDGGLSNIIENTIEIHIRTAKVAASRYHDPQVRLMHNEILRTVLESMRMAQCHQAKSLVVATASTYLYTFMNRLSNVSWTHVDPAFEEAKDLLLYMREYRRECLYNTDPNSPNHSRLLWLQRTCITRNGRISFRPTPRQGWESKWGRYFSGMFDMQERYIPLSWKEQEVKDVIRDIGSYAYEFAKVADEVSVTSPSGRHVVAAIPSVTEDEVPALRSSPNARKEIGESNATMPSPIRDPGLDSPLEEVLVVGGPTSRRKRKKQAQQYTRERR